MNTLQNALSRDFSLRTPSRFVTEPLVRRALLEDLAHGDDITTDAIVPADARGAPIVSRAPGVVAGVDAALLAFELLDPNGVAVVTHVADGERASNGVNGRSNSTGARARSSRVSVRRSISFAVCRGIATATRALVDIVAGTHAQIVDTRKDDAGTTRTRKVCGPCGGGSNHRFGFDDAVLIKDNHLALAGSIHEAVAAFAPRPVIW